ncbi:MAG: UDP-N-acetylglucosamine 2-epimerase (non-hydrolyzing) [Myxococcales bacterium]|nr:UDP-N-acetylglucosamine 2-epimerase (non-hydrolyzing) [Myxococcales bacterium]
MTTSSLVHIVGARPQFVKMAVVLDAWRHHIEPVIIHTGQHYDTSMSSVFFDELAIPKPHHNLNAGGGTHGSQTAAMLTGLEPLLQERPTGVAVVYGDTNSTLAGALVAAKLGWKIVHVESGLRSFDRQMPEEINRIAVDHLSSHLLCPTQKAMKQLDQEGLGDRAYFTGDVMFDASLRALNRSWVSPLARYLTDSAADKPDYFSRGQLDILKTGQYGVATLHRASNTDDPKRLASLIETLGQLDWPVFLPLHPRTKKAMVESNIEPKGQLHVIEPLGYIDFAALVASSVHVLTDSGGLQKEALFHRRLCTTMRDTTEWPETLTDSWNCLVGSDPQAIQQAAARAYPGTEPPIDAFGAGSAATAVNSVVIDALGIETKIDTSEVTYGV